MQTTERPLRVALVSYRSKAHVGGQGIYLRHLSRELAALGHQVEVFSGQPYPELEPGPVLRTLPSLDLYREPDPFRTPGLSEFRDWIDVLEFLWMKTGAFPEPCTFSLRLRRALLPRLADFDLVHDNQVLAYGLLALPRAGMPLVTSIHHPISVDRRIELKAAKRLGKLAKWRWYSFVRMQARVARRCGTILTASQSSAADICRDFGAAPGNVRVIPLGVDTRLFHPRPAPRGAGRGWNRRVSTPSGMTRTFSGAAPKSRQMSAADDCDAVRIVPHRRATLACIRTKLYQRHLASLLSPLAAFSSIRRSTLIGWWMLVTSGIPALGSASRP